MNLEEELAALKGEYLIEARSRLSEMGGILDRLAHDRGDRASLDALMRHFHAFAGSGTTYGLPTVTAAGSDAERLCRERLAAPGPAAEDEVARWRAKTGEIRAHIEAATVTVPPGAAAAAEVPRATTRRAQDILVVDDDTALRTAIRQMLEQEGFSVREAGSYSAAMAALDTRVPDGLVTDVVLPDGSGYELVATLRTLPRGESAAALVVSKLAGLLDRVEAVQCGADGYFEKPLDWPALLRRLEGALARERSDPARILAVEDDPQQAAFLRAVLSSAGYELRICADPRHFEADLTSFRPDMLLMDVVLPEVSGFDLVRVVRQQERYATLPIVFLTTQAEIDSRMVAARSGGDELLPKPVAPGLLLSTVAARVERSRLLRSLLEKDGLTGLFTHTAFHERARALVSQKARDQDRKMAWVLVDVDHFKSVNDRFGHPAGDRVLASLGALMRRRLRQSDALGRYGGEEFAILLLDLGADDAQRIVQRLLDEFRTIEHTTGGDAPLRCAFSAGVSMLEPGMTVDAWKQAADDALYRAKREGRARVVVADPPSA